MGEKIKILMVDDEPELCSLVKENLEETQEFEVVTTCQAQEVEALCKSQKPDILLLDNIMPGRNGADIVKTLKRDPEIKMIPVIMVSGKGEMVYSKKKKQFQWLPNNPIAKDRHGVVEGKDVEVLAKAYGVAAYVSKPFATEALIDVIKEVNKNSKKMSDEEETGVL